MDVTSQSMKQLPLYQCHKKVWALKIAAIVEQERPVFIGATCKGCYALGTACGHCERCAFEKEHGPSLGASIVPVDKSYLPFYVSGEFLAKHKPEAGGYFVQYADGYKSFSPAAVFEEGYTLIT